MRVGQARKRDANEAEIVAALRACGARVDRISGPGLPDLLVGYKGFWVPLEIKSATGRLTKRQRLGAPYPIARSVDEALRAIGIV